MMSAHSVQDPAMTLDEFISSERRKMTAARLREMAGFTARLREKVQAGGADPDLRLLGDALVGLLESGEVRDATDPLPRHLAEAGVGAAYLLKGADLIPDHVPGIGLADDAIILRKIFHRNPGLGRNGKTAGAAGGISG